MCKLDTRKGGVRLLDQGSLARSPSSRRGPGRAWAAGGRRRRPPAQRTRPAGATESRSSRTPWTSAGTWWPGSVRGTHSTCMVPTAAAPSAAAAALLAAARHGQGAFYTPVALWGLGGSRQQPFGEELASRGARHCDPGLWHWQAATGCPSLMLSSFPPALLLSSLLPFCPASCQAAQATSPNRRPWSAAMFIPPGWKGGVDGGKARPVDGAGQTS
jgi:hypothetical protein